jgi:dTDP-4-dehydrorhamnose reductase
MNVLLLGANGYIGRAFLHSKAPEGLTLIPVDRTRVDYFNHTTLRQLIHSERAEVLLNCSGYTGKPNVDECEKNKDLCFRLNVLWPEQLSRIAASCKIQLIQIGSGCIYQGVPQPKEPERGFMEEDEPNFNFDHPPCSFYSGTKAEMEKRIRHVPGVSIWRIRMPFTSDWDDRNLLAKLTKYPKILEAKNSITDLTEMIDVSLRMLVARVPSDIYNLTNPGVVANSEIIKMLLRQRIRTLPAAYFQSLDEIANVMEAPRSACVLDSTKVLKLGFPMRSVHDALEKAISGLKASL